MADEFHVDDIGALFLATIESEGSGLDISSATTKNFIFKRPDGTTNTVGASFVSGGSDGALQYVTTSGDLNQGGLWRLQAHLIMGTNNWKTEISPFFVYPNL